MTQTAFSYDEVPYSSFTFPQTRPDRLATLAAFHGMTPADPGNCRVLELGCGDGTNLVSFAYILPNSKFVGVDLAAGHIEQADRTKGELGLKNISFQCADVMDFTREKFGEFDYIVAHGLFSWVPDFVRVKVLEIYKECLAPQGVGYISYNALPGCHIRQMIWHMMQYHTAAVEAPMAKVQNGINFLNFLVHATPKDSLYQSLIKMELSQFAQRTPENIYHGDLALMSRVGLPVAVADAVPEVAAAAAYVTKLAGGHGAIREVTDLLLSSRPGDQRSKSPSRANSSSLPFTTAGT